MAGLCERSVSLTGLFSFGRQAGRPGAGGLGALRGHAGVPVGRCGQHRWGRAGLTPPPVGTATFSPTGLTAGARTLTLRAIAGSWAGAL